ncbi:MAG: hypothetical protein ACREJC_03955 [Tepidisphaeraceae bacterium]
MMMLTMPDKALSNPRIQAAGTRAIEAHVRLRRVATRLSEELEETTSPHGIQTANFDDEDSMVIAVERVIASAKG